MREHANTRSPTAEATGLQSKLSVRGDELTGISISCHLGSYPFQDDDPFVMETCPHLFFVGCQPEFGTKVIEGPEGQAVRLIAVPSFSRTRELVLVDTETLDVSRVKFTTGTQSSP